VPREHRVRHLRQHAVVVAEHARKQRVAGPQLGEQVAPHLVAHAKAAPTAPLQLAERLRLCQWMTSGFDHKPAVTGA
jgi:hypothetical protein